MTRKDYIALAEVIAAHKEDADNGYSARLILGSVTGMVADVLERDNERFDRERFFTACGYRLEEGVWR